MESTGDRDTAGRRQLEERGQKRKAEAKPGPVVPRASLRSPAEWVPLDESLVAEADPKMLVHLAIKIVRFLHRTFDMSVFSRKCVVEMVENGVIPALVKRLEAPPSGEGDSDEQLTSDSDEELIGDSKDAIGRLRPLLNRLKADSSSHVRAAETISKLVLGNITISANILVRMGGGIPLLVELLDADDIHVQGAAAAALWMMASENEENRNQIVDCGALPSIVLILKSDSADIHIKAVALISVLLFSSSHLKKDVLAAGALQPIIRLLSSSCVFSQMEAARLVELFAAAHSVRKAIVQRGAVRPLIEMLRSPELKARELSASALWTLAQNSDSQVGIAHEGGLLALLGLLDSESESLQRVAIRALHTLLDTEDNVSDFITIGGFQKLQRGEFTARATTIHVEGTVKKLEQKIRGPVFKHLLLLMRASENNTIQGRVAVALAHLSHPTNQRMIFIDNNGLKLLLGLLTSLCPEEQVDGALALFKLANNAIVVSPASADSPAPAPRVYLSEQYVNNAMQSDVTFLVESRQFYAHRICLCASSDTFCAMLDGAYKEKDTTTIEIPNIRWETFELMIRFMYCGSVEITPDIAPELLRAADQYLIEGLKRLCESAIAQEISIETISTIYELSKDFHATSLRHSCFLFILEHFHEFRHRYSHLIQGTVSAIRDHFSASGN